MRAGLEHKDWRKVRQSADKTVPVVNRRAQRWFCWTCVAIGEVWLALLVAWPITASRFFAMCLALGAVLGVITGAWPHHHPPRRHTTLRIAGGWLVYLAGRHMVNRALERGRRGREV
jgi:hypothetical protein